PTAVVGNGLMPSGPSFGNGRSGRAGRRGFRERTLEEQCEHLVNAVLDCKREVAASPFYSRLLAVLSEAASNHMAYLRQQVPPADHHSTKSATAVQPQARQQQQPPQQEAGQQHEMPQQQPQQEQTQGQGRGDEAMAEGEEATEEVKASNADIRSNGDCGKPGSSSGMDDDAGGGEGGGGGRGGAEGKGAPLSCLPYSSSSSAWSSVYDMVVYGLGSVHESRVSRYQLALVLLLRDQVLSGLRSAVQLYDPAFDQVDRLALQRLGLQALDVNEGGARRVTRPTLFYLPHCEGALCDALLGANWGPLTEGAAAAAAAAAAGIDG
ncbi:hypothetical protein Agub_g14263, partial [Astrephomene gubernaculifera]